MALSDSFTQVFDKSKAKGHICHSNGIWVVAEHEPKATMNRLEVCADGDFVGFDHDLVKGVADLSAGMSSKLEDKDCDGIAFLTDKVSKEHLIFAELKSNFDVQKIAGAFHQIIMSFIKMHAWLSLCKGYDLKNLTVHFITACRCCKSKDQEDNIMLRISEAQQLGKNNFETKFLKPLMKNHRISVQMSLFGDIRRLPFHESLSDKEVTMYLQLTDTPNDSQTSVIL